jgi:hypothetical protein
MEDLMPLDYPDFSTMSDAEIADWQYAHKDDLDDALVGDDYERVDARPATNAAVVTSFRMPPGELEEIRSASDAAGLTLSEWIRSACKAALGRPAPSLDRAELTRLLQAARRDVAEAERLVGS